ncbi:interleukin-1 beta-like [Hyperolius riggenbachi]|uniref:interleukin-1 beta-like n=1 Tax=Hyperolius riggenbachi TaxID=752182 RepID=UPI0035A26581
MKEPQAPTKSLNYTISQTHVKNIAQYGDHIEALCKGVPTFFSLEVQEITMAEVPEFSDIPMDIYSEMEEEFYSDYSCEIKASDLASSTLYDNDDNKTFVKRFSPGSESHWGRKSCSSDWSACRSDTLRGIQKPSKSAQAFRKAIMLVVVVEKLKGRKSSKSQCIFDDHDLLDHILVEEDIPFKRAEAADLAPTKFRYHSTTVHIIRDRRQKCLTLQEYQGNTHLVALFLQGQNLEKEAKINMGAYIASNVDGQRRPVTLGIAGHSLYLSCAAEEGNQSMPVVSVMEIKNIQEKKNEDLLPFMFYRVRHADSTNTFESVAFPGWYISTSQVENEQVRLKPQEDQTCITDFMVYASS